MVLQLGLTGGIGSGKSTVAAMWAALGASVVDADALSREFTAVGGKAISDIQKAFGASAIAQDGSLNRDAMRHLVFAAPHAKQQLEAIIHPLVAQGIAQARTQAEQAGASVLVLDIPLLAESARWRAEVGYVLVVDCDHATQIERVYSRSGWTAEQTQRVIDAQASRALRLAAADIVISNQGIDLSQLEAMVQKIAQQFGL